MPGRLPGRPDRGHRTTVSAINRQLGEAVEGGGEPRVATPGRGRAVLTSLAARPDEP